MPAKTRPAATPTDHTAAPLLGLFIPPSPRLPRGALFVVGTPVSAASPARVTPFEFETTAEPLTDWVAA